MTAAYGLPDHLFAPVETAVEMAWMNSIPGNATFQGRDLHLLVDLWRVRVENEVHTDLLYPQYARELLAVITPAILLNGQNPNSCESAQELDIHAEELIMTLQDIASSSSVAA